jgi:acylphosphatase|tara:strand:+ start:4277 stop:4546 length:270 start_codon:yes stop_codon:yes gene_type:complete
MIGSHISIYGEVQGSGFRSWAKEQSAKLNLMGWARKASDGSIEIFVQGEEEPLNVFISLCWDGPSFAHVEDVLVQDANHDESIKGFEIY